MDAPTFYIIAGSMGGSLHLIGPFESVAQARAGREDGLGLIVQGWRVSEAPAWPMGEGARAQAC